MSRTRTNPDPPDDWTRNGARVVCALLLTLSAALGIASARGLAPASSQTPIALRTGVDINSAPAAELALLPGIGPALSAAIVRERESVGPFLGADDLARVKGIGARRVKNVRGHAVALPPLAGPLAPAS